MLVEDEDRELGGTGAARVPRVRMPGRTDSFSIDSAALAGNPLGDPARRPVPVWLPPSYDHAPGRRYPVVYWLSGFASTGASFFQGTPWSPALADRLDRLVAAGRMGEVIVVAPDCFTRFGGSQYIDSPATGRYETHLCHELIPPIDARYRTAASRAGRAVGGKSSGGFGALVLAMRHPALYAAIASHADALRGMRRVFLDAGTRDEWALDVGARVMAARMRALGVPVEHEEFDDGHMTTSYRYEVSQ